MSKQAICQSCGMPMIKETDFGTNKDGNRDTEYCHYCYQAGQFTNPNLTLEQQIDKLSHMTMGNEAISQKNATAQATKTLPNLKRWRGQEQQKTPKQKRIVFIILTIALIIGVVVTIIAKKTSNASGASEDSDSWSAIYMIPIWVAVFIPIISQKKKNKLQNQAKDPLQKKQLFLLIIGMLLLVTGVFITIFFNEVK